jgi:NAD(P)-dependent dehydrogenase (short-subunit alcohol dehydrogenase family)
VRRGAGPPADVSDAAAVERVAERAVAEFGRIDGWVNNAGVTMFGRLVDVPLDDVRRVVEVNLMGQVHGARAALPRMIAQGSGVLVNVSSILGVIAQPYGSAYTMTKFAVRGLSFSLREELRRSGVRGVHVSTVLPAAIDTPVYASAANHSGRRISPPPPVYRAERVAATIVAQLRRPRRQVVSGGVLGRLFVAQHRLAPRFTEHLLAREVDLTLARTDPPVPPTSGTLYEPATDPTPVDGGWRGARRERVRRVALVLAAAGVTAGAAAVARSSA